MTCQYDDPKTKYVVASSTCTCRVLLRHHSGFRDIDVPLRVFNVSP